MYKNVSKLKKGAVAAVAAGLMLGALPGAALAQTVGASTVANTTVVTKTWTAASDAQLNDTEKFTFGLSFKSSTPQGTNEVQGFSSFDTKTVELTSQWRKNATNHSASATLRAATLFGDTDFNKPGIYVFDLKEVAGTNTNIKYDTTQYTVTVNVAWNDDYPTNPSAVIKSVTVNDASGKKQDANKGATFNNTAKENSSLTVSKTVAGTAANTADDFTFSVTFSGLTGNYDLIKKGDVTIKDAWGNIVSQVTNGTYTITMGHDESIKFKNLPKDANYTVEETNANGYTSTDITETQASNDMQTNGTIGDEDVNVSFKNEKGFAPSTGITMNTLPFVGVGAVAAAGTITLVISRKRRAGEEF